MGVTSVHEIWSNRRVEAKSDGKDILIRSFRALTDDPTVAPLEVLADAGIPTQGEAHPDDAASTVIRRDAKQDQDDPQTWVVDVQYERYATSPLSDPIEVSIASQTRQVAVESDLSTPSQAIVNSARECFDPPPTKDDYDLTITVKKNYASTTSPVTLSAFLGTLNSGGVTLKGITYAAGTLKASGLRCEYKTRNGTDYLEVSWTFLRKADWKIYLLDQGFNKLNDANELVPIMVRGQKITRPRPLDGLGGELDVAGGAAAVYLDYVIYPSTSWAGMGL